MVRSGETFFVKCRFFFNNDLVYNKEENTLIADIGVLLRQGQVDIRGGMEDEDYDSDWPPAWRGGGRKK